MKAFTLIFLLTTSLNNLITAQVNATRCQNIYVWDVFQDNGKKSVDPMIVSDIEAAIASNKGTTVLGRRNFENIPLRIKNEKANQKTDKISDALAKRLSDEGVKNILFTILTEGKGSNTILSLKIYELQSHSIVFSKDVIMPKAVYENNREKRKELLADFFKKEVLGVEPPLKNTLVWSGVGVGTAVTAFGVIKTLSIKNTWKNYLANNAFDTEKTYPSKNKSYKTNQFVAIGGGVVLATSAYFLYQKMKKEKKHEALNNKNAPKTSLILEPLLDNTAGLGFAVKF